MKRDVRLQGLSRDHHQALVLARQADRASVGAAQEQVETWKRIESRFETELDPHFRVEEELLLTALEERGELELAGRTRREHAELRKLVRRSERPLKSRLTLFSNILRQHVRFEERELFPCCEVLLRSDLLDAVHRARP